MTNDVIGLPRGRSFTRADLDALPDDGWRHELVDGLLIMSPAPRPVHQRVVGNMHLALRASCPTGLEALFAPLDVALADDTVLQPDLLVAHRADFTTRDLPTAPVLAIEVLSPSTRAYDLLLKKDRLERAGCEHYWVIDPDVPAITAWILRNGVYREAASVVGDEPLVVSDPYAITAVPTALVSD